MKCQICQNEIDTNIRQQDNSVICPFCGTVYRQKIKPESIGNVKQAEGLNIRETQHSKRNVSLDQASSNRNDIHSEYAGNTKAKPIPSSVNDPSFSHEIKRETPKNEDPNLWEEQSERNRKPAQKKINKEEYSKKSSDQSSKRTTVKGIIFLAVIAVVALLGYLFATGTVELPFIKANNKIDPNKNVMVITPNQSLPTKSDENKRDSIIVIANNSNIYSAPENTSMVLGLASRGDRFALLESIKSHDDVLWYRINIDGIDGWISYLYAIKHKNSTENDETPVPSTKSVLLDLRLTDKKMYYLEAEKNTHLCFTVSANTGLTSIQLIQKDTGESVGQMLDDGKGEDEKAGDGLYTLGINVCGNNYGKVVYLASKDDSVSNDVNVQFFQKPSEESDSCIEDIFTGIRSANGNYADIEGYIPASYRSAAIQAVADYIEDKYYTGDIAEYSIDEDGVCFREKRTGVLIMYDPKVKGDLASGGGTDIVLGLPYANAKEEDQRVDPYSYNWVVDRIQERLDLSSTALLDENAMPEFFNRLRPGQVVLWNGHGGFHYLFFQYPYLVTGQYYDSLYEWSHFEDFLYTRMCVSWDIFNPRVCITPDYITEYCGDLTGAFIWLGSCHSGQNSTLADSFLNKGASTVIGYSKTVYTMYDKAMLVSTFINLLDGLGTNTQGMTIGEAIRKSREDYGEDEVKFWDIWNNGQSKPDDINERKPARIVLFGNENYRLKGKLKPTPTPEPTATPIPTATPTKAPTATPYVDYSKFSIIGKWKSVGSYGFGQAQPGTIVIFDDTYCNFYSPRDTYAVYESGGKLVLDITSLLFRENLMFDIQIIDNDHIKIVYSPNAITELTRVN